MRATDTHQVASANVDVFTDAPTVAANTFTTSTVDITTVPSTALVTFSSMAPGDSVMNKIVPTNAGSMAIQYAISTPLLG